MNNKKTIRHLRSHIVLLLEENSNLKAENIALTKQILQLNQEQTQLSQVIKHIEHITNSVLSVVEKDLERRKQ